MTLDNYMSAWGNNSLQETRSILNPSVRNSSLIWTQKSCLNSIIMKSSTAMNSFKIFKKLKQCRAGEGRGVCVWGGGGLVQSQGNDSNDTVTVCSSYEMFRTAYTASNPGNNRVQQIGPTIKLRYFTKFPIMMDASS